MFPKILFFIEFSLRTLSQTNLYSNNILNLDVINQTGRVHTPSITNTKLKIILCISHFNPFQYMQDKPPFQIPPLIQ
jgi:hypothetical protein